MIRVWLNESRGWQLTELTVAACVVAVVVYALIVWLPDLALHVSAWRRQRYADDLLADLLRRPSTTYEDFHAAAQELYPDQQCPTCAAPVAVWAVDGRFWCPRCRTWRRPCARS